MIPPPFPLCFETLCVQNRQHGPLLPYHEARLNATRRALWGCRESICLEPLLAIPEHLGPQKYKCRLTYGPAIERIEWESYAPRVITSLRLVNGGSITYARKYKNREELDTLFADRRGCDDVLIIKDGYITDTSYANVALFDGQHWYTPATPLLSGTQRAFLLRTGLLIPRAICPDQLAAYTHLRLFNAMLSWQEGPTLPIGNIVPINGEALS